MVLSWISGLKAEQVIGSGYADLEFVTECVQFFAYPGISTQFRHILYEQPVYP